MRIHDVVQQLPLLHYRSTKSLIRHMSRVAEHLRKTGMHIKNLAIVGTQTGEVIGITVFLGGIASPYKWLSQSVS